LELVNISQKVEKISLDGLWELKNSDKSVELDAQVPGTVFEALLENNIIEDPFYGENEHKMKWVFESNWIYRKEFNLDPEFLENKNIILRFNGLDTIADVNLNGELIGSVNNMFVRYDFEVKSNLKQSGNKIEISFKSPAAKSREFLEKDKAKLNTGYAAIPGVPYLRKTQYSFGWDWGPKLPDLGIWKSVELVGFDDIKINSVFPYANFEFLLWPFLFFGGDDTEYGSKQFKRKVEIWMRFFQFIDIGHRVTVCMNVDNHGFSFLF